MANIFVVSDTHFHHANMLNFKQNDGTPMRPFAGVQEMDEHMVDKWNSVVRPQDHVYHLGDVAMGRASIDICGRLNGHLRLCLGNHDDHAVAHYLKYFKKIFATRRIDNMILSHIPIHPGSLGRAVANIHGHVHHGSLPPPYINVSVEVIDYTPVSIEDLRKITRSWHA